MSSEDDSGPYCRECYGSDFVCRECSDELLAQLTRELEEERRINHELKERISELEGVVGEMGERF